MAGVSVEVKPEIINWILRTIQFDSAASPAVELLNKWRTGEKKPTFNQVEDISRKTNVPFGYFFLDKPPVEECPIVEYRTVKNLSIPEPSRNLIDTVDLMIDIQSWMTEYVVDNGQDELGYVGSAENVKDFNIIADDIRSTLRIEKDWYVNNNNAADSFRYLKNHLGDLGIVVMMNGIVGNNTRRKLNVDEFRAFTLVNKFAPLIFINTCDSDGGKLFSLLHELAHIWIGLDSFYNDSISNGDTYNEKEIICNAVAAEILVPTDIFIAKWNEIKGTDYEKVEILSKSFRCSRFVIARKALDKGKITKKAYTEIIFELTKNYKEWKERQKINKSSGGDFYRTLGSKLDHRFLYALASSAKEGRTQYSEVYRLTNTNRKTFGNLLTEVGGA